MIFDPDLYTITIRKENVDGDLLYVGRVAEFDNLSAYEETYEEAREILLDAIQTLKTMADEAGSAFPQPNPVLAEEYSGRPSLRLPKSLHARSAKLAEQENVSLNTFLVSAIATYIGQCDGIEKIARESTKIMILLIKGSEIRVVPSGASMWNTSLTSLLPRPPTLTLASGKQFMEAR